MSTELSDLKLDNKFLKDMSYEDIEKAFNSSYGWQLWNDEKTAVRDVQYSVIKDSENYMNQKFQNLPEARIVNLQEKLSFPEDKIFQSPQAAYFYILALIVGTKVDIVVTQKTNEKTIGDPDGGYSEKVYDEEEIKTSRGKPANLEEAIKLRNKVLASFSPEQSAEADVFKNHVNSQIKEKFSNLQNLLNRTNQKINTIENGSHLDEKTISDIKNIQEKIRNISPVVMAELPGLKAESDKFNQLLVKFKNDFERKLDFSVSTAQDMNNLKLEYQQLARVIKLDKNVEEKLQKLENDLKIKMAAENKIELEKKINDLLQNGKRIYQEINQEYKKFENIRKEFQAGNIDKKNFKEQKAEIEKKVNKTLGDAGLYLHALSGLKNVDSKSQTYIELTNLRDNINNLKEFIKIKENIADAKRKAINKIRNTLEESGETLSNGIETYNKETILDNDNIKKFVKIFNSSDFSPHTNENIKNLRISVKEYEELCKTDAILNENNISASVKKFNESCPANIKTIINHTHEEKGFWSSVGKYLAKVASNLNKLLNPAFDQIADRKNIAAHSSAETFKLSLPQSPKSP